MLTKQMIVEFLNDLKKTIEAQFQYNTSLPKLLNNDKSLDIRMRKNIKKYNSTTYHGFKPFIISLKSKQLLNYISGLSIFDKKVKELDIIQDALFYVGKKIYKRYDPNLIYTFQNELNIVFYYNDSGIYMFNGNVMKTVTSLASFVSVEVSKLLYKRGIDIDLHFTGQFVEFDIDYEVLNYLVWRQMDCRRNNITLLYKCLNMNSVLDGELSIENIKVDDMLNSFEVIIDNPEQRLHHLLTGNVIKKRVFYIERNDLDKKNDKDNDNNVVSRRSVGVEHIKFSDNFKDNYKKYIINKMC